jgi:hypothetical protein
MAERYSMHRHITAQPLNQRQESRLLFSGSAGIRSVELEQFGDGYSPGEVRIKNRTFSGFEVVLARQGDAWRSDNHAPARRAPPRRVQLSPR